MKINKIRSRITRLRNVSGIFPIRKLSIYDFIDPERIMDQAPFGI